MAQNVVGREITTNGSMHKLYWSPRYTLHWEGHVFPGDKYRGLRDRLMDSGMESSAALHEPQPMWRDELETFHEAAYLDRLYAMTVDPLLGMREFEGPSSGDVIEAYRWMAGGTLAACRSALATGFSANLGGGFHHAFPHKGEGFCALHDVACSIRVLQREGAIGRAAVLDLDVHQGNGTAFGFAGDPDVFTASLHQEKNYPAKQASDLDIGLPDSCRDVDYLDSLRDALAVVLDHAPDLLVYVAGADPYEEDQLGGLALSLEGLRARDRLVFETCAARSVPVAATLAGGYARDSADVIEIHYGMIQEGLASIR